MNDSHDLVQALVRQRLQSGSTPGPARQAWADTGPEEGPPVPSIDTSGKLIDQIV